MDGYIGLWHAILIMRALYKNKDGTIPRNNGVLFCCCVTCPSYPKTISTITVSWSAQSSRDGTGSGSGSATFTRYDDATGTIPGGMFRWRKNCEGNFECAFGTLADSSGYYNISAGSYSTEDTSQGGTCSVESDATVKEISLSGNGVDGYIWRAVIGTKGASHIEYCINSGMFDPYATSSASVDPKGTFTVTNSGGQWGGTYSYTITIVVA